MEISSLRSGSNANLHRFKNLSGITKVELSNPQPQLLQELEIGGFVASSDRSISTDGNLIKMLDEIL